MKMGNSEEIDDVHRATAKAQGNRDSMDDALLKEELRWKRRIARIPRQCPRCGFSSKDPRRWDLKKKVCWGCKQCGEPTDSSAVVNWERTETTFIIPHHIIRWREHNGLSLRQAAAVMGRSPGWLSKFENQRSPYPWDGTQVPVKSVAAWLGDVEAARVARAIPASRVHQPLGLTLHQYRTLCKYKVFTDEQRQIVDSVFKERKD